MYKDFNDSKVEDLVFTHHFFVFTSTIFSFFSFISSLLLRYHFNLFDSYHFFGGLVLASSFIWFFLSLIISCVYITRFLASVLEKRKNRKIAIDNALKDIDFIKDKVSYLSIQSKASVLVDNFTSLLNKKNNSSKKNKKK